MYSKLVNKFLKASGEPLTAVSADCFSSQEIQFIRTMILDELEELNRAEDFCEQLDALVDIIYYACHASAKRGIDLDPLFEIVHNANMAKVEKGVIRREDGKIEKPPGWEDPRPLLMREITRQLSASANSL